MVVMQVSSRVCWAKDRTIGTPASHFFLSPEDGLSSAASDAMLGKKWSKLVKEFTKVLLLLLTDSDILHYGSTV